METVPIKTREFSGVYFHLKGWLLLGTTKLNVTMSAEGGLPTTGGRMTSPLITNNQLNCWFDFFNSILLIP